MYISGVATALFPDIIYETLKQNSSFLLNPMTVQMYHEREGVEGACFCLCKPPQENHGLITIRPVRPGTEEPAPVPRLTRKQWKMLKMKAKASENKDLSTDPETGKTTAVDKKE
jgi:hypothetical protein